MISEGADIIDIGGESTRPAGSAYGKGAEVVDAAEELRRVLPIISQLAKETDTPISIDTYKSEVASRALEAGATIVNDISGFGFDSKMPETVAKMGGSVVLMHIKGTPKTMQANTSYEKLFHEVRTYLQKGIERAQNFGITQIIVDPGIGFGKNEKHNLQLLNRLADFQSLGFPILVGASRKSFIGKILDLPIEKRLEGSLATAVSAVLNGANIVRVHDVKETKYAVMMADAIKKIEMN
jgi:dihydropteroate synthase